jgi:hypothetical protein
MYYTSCNRNSFEGTWKSDVWNTFHKAIPNDANLRRSFVPWPIISSKYKIRVVTWNELKWQQNANVSKFFQLYSNADLVFQSTSAFLQRAQSVFTTSATQTAQLTKLQTLHTDADSSTTLAIKETDRCRQFHHPSNKRNRLLLNELHKKISSFVNLVNLSCHKQMKHFGASQTCWY